MNYNESSKEEILIELFELKKENEALKVASQNNILKFENALDAYRKSEEKQSKLVDRMFEGLLVVDNDDVIQFANPMFCQMLGYNLSELVGQIGYSILLSESDRDNILMRNLDRMKGVSERYELQMVKKDGGIITLLMSASPLDDSEGKIIGSMSTCLDITERKWSEEELKKLNEELKQSNVLIKQSLDEKNALVEELSASEAKLKDTINTKDKFFSIISHDLRTPFSGFLGLTKMLVESFHDLSLREMKESANNMQISANSLYTFLENLLEWSRIQRNVIVFNPENCMLHFLIKQNIEIQYENYNQKEIKMNISISDEVCIYADIPMVNTVIRNLISNAIKFTPRGGSIEIGTQDIQLSNGLMSSDNSSNVCIYVKDSGIGMNDSLLNKLFQIDKKVSRPGTENEPSSGLGLLLCKEFIEKNDGKIWVESEVGIGTTFYFTLKKHE